jgi:hypothetical protein
MGSSVDLCGERGGGLLSGRLRLVGGSEQVFDDRLEFRPVGEPRCIPGDEVLDAAVTGMIEWVSWRRGELEEECSVGGQAR